MTSERQPLDLSLDACRKRQQWLASTLQTLNADRAILVRREHVQYLTGFRPHKLMTALVSVDPEGRCLLVAPNQPPSYVAADEVVTFEAQWHCTLRQDQMLAAWQVLQDTLASRRLKKIAVEVSSFPAHCQTNAELVDIEPQLLKRRRKKDPDELAMIRRAIQCTDAMYARAKEIINPGISEIEVFNQLHAAAVEVAGEPLTDLGNDYQCGSPGGLPRSRAAESGELFILDLGPAYRGYYADNCRTFAVNRQPTSPQLRAWEKIVACLQMVEQTVKPGVHCRAVFERAQAMLDEYQVGSFAHHLGHGIGLFPHEAPHLNPFWNDVFEEGDVFTAEPGLYGKELLAGIRLEQNYRVTATGVELLTSFPLELT